MIETEWIKFDMDAKPYEAFLVELEGWKLGGSIEFNLKSNFFKAYDIPVHPVFVVERLQEFCYKAEEQSFIHLAISHSRCRDVLKCEQVMDIIWRLIRCRFSLEAKK